MKTGVHSNSIQAFHSQRDRLSRRAELVLEWLEENGPATDRQVMQGLGFAEPNAVRPRVTELMEAGRIVEVDSVRCQVTGKTVRRVDVRRESQLRLFS